MFPNTLYIIGCPCVNDDARPVVGVDRDKAREDRELLEGGYEKFLTAFNKETTRTARISPLKRPVLDIYQNICFLAF